MCGGGGAASALVVCAHGCMIVCDDDVARRTRRTRRVGGQHAKPWTFHNERWRHDARAKHVIHGWRGEKGICACLLQAQAKARQLLAGTSTEVQDVYAMAGGGSMGHMHVRCQEHAMQETCQMHEGGHACARLSAELFVQLCMRVVWLPAAAAAIREPAPARPARAGSPALGCAWTPQAAHVPETLRPGRPQQRLPLAPLAADSLRRLQVHARHRSGTLLLRGQRPPAYALGGQVALLLLLRRCCSLAALLHHRVRAALGTAAPTTSAHHTTPPPGGVTRAPVAACAPSCTARGRGACRSSSSHGTS